MGTSTDKMTSGLYANVSSMQAEVHTEDVKPQTLPLTETSIPIYQSEQHYPVIVMKTEDAPVTAHVPVVIPEEKPASEPQTIASDEMPVQHEEQSYEQEPAVDGVTEQEMEDHNVIDGEQEQNILPSQEETENVGMYEPGDDVDEQSYGQPHEQPQEEISAIPVAEEQRFVPEESENLPAQDSSVSWMEKPVPADTQEPEEFYSPEEQDIPQSHTYEDYQEESHDGDVLVSSDSREPWVMVDYPPAPEQENHFLPTPEQENYFPPAPEQENYFPSQDNISGPPRMPMEIPNEQFTHEVPEEAENEYHYEEEGAENEEADETPVVEVCTMWHEILAGVLFC